LIARLRKKSNVSCFKSAVVILGTGTPSQRLPFFCKRNLSNAAPFILHKGQNSDLKIAYILLKDLFCNCFTLFSFCFDAKRNKKIKAATKKAEK